MKNDSSLQYDECSKTNNTTEGILLKRILEVIFNNISILHIMVIERIRQIAKPICTVSARNIKDK